MQLSLYLNLYINTYCLLHINIYIYLNVMSMKTQRDNEGHNAANDVQL